MEAQANYIILHFCTVSTSARTMKQLLMMMLWNKWKYNKRSCDSAAWAFTCLLWLHLFVYHFPYRVLGLDCSTMFVMYMIRAGMPAATWNWRTMSFLGLIGKINILKTNKKLFLIPNYSPVSRFMFVSGKTVYCLRRTALLSLCRPAATYYALHT